MNIYKDDWEMWKQRSGQGRIVEFIVALSLPNSSLVSERADDTSQTTDKSYKLHTNKNIPYIDTLPNNYTTTILWPFVRDYPGESVPEG